MIVRLVADAPEEQLLNTAVVAVTSVQPMSDSRTVWQAGGSLTAGVAAAANPETAHSSDG